MPTTTWDLLGNAGNPSTAFLGTTDTQPVVIRTSNTERLRIDKNGYVGVGTSAPTERVQVEGSVFVDGEGNGVIVDAAGLERVGLMKYPGNEAALVGSTQLANPVRLGRWEGGTIHAPSVVHIDMVIDAGGNVGVGTGAPAAKLGVVSSTVAPAVSGVCNLGIAMRAQSQRDTGLFATSDAGVGVDARSNSNVAVTASSQLGVAVRAAAQKNTGLFATSDSGMGLDARSNSNVGVQAISQTNTGLFATSTSGVGVDARSAQGIAVRAQAQNDTGVFATSNAGRGIDGRSTTGIGVFGEGGQYAGYFHGNIVVTGDVLLPGADCAEHFDVVEHECSPEPGTVVVIDREGRLKASGEAYDRKVAGVVSGAGAYRHAIVLDKRESDASRVPVALVGKVYCKVDAQYGPIDIGDLLTSSPTRGHAMKATEPNRAFGAILGKALRPLAYGTALIPVLVALQ